MSFWHTQLLHSETVLVSMARIGMYGFGQDAFDLLD